MQDTKARAVPCCLSLHISKQQVENGSLPLNMEALLGDHVS